MTNNEQLFFPVTLLRCLTTQQQSCNLSGGAHTHVSLHCYVFSKPQTTSVNVIPPENMPGSTNESESQKHNAVCVILVIPHGWCVSSTAITPDTLISQRV